MVEISIVAGLGNPGANYRSTRHNLGFMALDALARRRALSWKRAAGPAQRALWRSGKREIALIKPLRYMNESGFALARCGIVEPGTLLVVCDDLNLPIGKLRFKKRGGSGAHKGIDSVIESLGTEDFPRLRLGIGPPPSSAYWVEFVLSEFLAEERDRVNRMIETAADAIEMAVRDGLDAAMQCFNRPNGDSTQGTQPGDST